MALQDQKVLRPGFLELYGGNSLSLMEWEVKEWT
jgi:hypothetical protein